VVEFDYIPEMIGDTGSEYGPSSRGRYVGTIAQEMKEWAPWAVNDGEGDPEGDHIWKVEYDHVVPLLLKGIQELREELKSLKEVTIRENLDRATAFDERISDMELTDSTGNPSSNLRQQLDDIQSLLNAQSIEIAELKSSWYDDLFTQK